MSGSLRESNMNKWIDEIKYDLNFIQSHTLQPGWYKIAKVFILLGLIGGYYFLFGLVKTFVFIFTFMLLSTIVHFVYRIRTKRWSQSWLDFIVVEENGEVKYKRIGKFYYSAVIVNAILSVLLSQALL